MLLQYANYNLWANGLIIECINAQDETLEDKEVVSSFSSLRKTVYHTWGAEFIWLQRLKGAEQPIWLPNSFKGTLMTACKLWQDASKGLAILAEEKDNDGFTEMIQYNDLKGNMHRSKACDMLQHVFNHSTCHRGQIVTMLRQLGVNELPSTDLIAYVRMNS